KQAFADRIAQLVKDGHWDSTVSMARNALMTPMDKYMRLAGEIEARNVQARRNMNAEERLTSGPESTRDYPASQSILRERGRPVPQAFFQADTPLSFTKVPTMGTRALEPVHLRMEAPFIDRPNSSLVSFGELQRAIGAARTFAFMLRMEDAIYDSASWK